MQHAWYVLAFDLDRSDWRTFRLDRIDGPISVPGHGFRHRPIPGGDPTQFVSDAFALAPYEHSAHVEVDARPDAVAAAMPRLSRRRITARGTAQATVELSGSDADAVVRDLVDLCLYLTVESVTATDAIHARLARLVPSLTP
ncbi:MAG TPA: WYL domain-containing protein [Ilumatobacteraceae bacterium]|nr:WYL domain-containing protein [Ilumatobacteraceae bacterium]